MDSDTDKREIEEAYANLFLVSLWKKNSVIHWEEGQLKREKAGTEVWDSC